VISCQFCDYSGKEANLRRLRLAFQGVTPTYMGTESGNLMSNNKQGDRILAQPWILPLAIVSGLASAYAIPWNYTNVSAFEIFTTLIPLIAQFALACLTSVFAFLGRPSWLGFLIATVSVSIINALFFGLNFWGVLLPGLPKALLIITAISLIPSLIWGRKKVTYSAPGSSNFETTNGSDW